MACNSALARLEKIADKGKFDTDREADCKKPPCPRRARHYGKRGNTNYHHVNEWHSTASPGYVYRLGIKIPGLS